MPFFTSLKQKRVPCPRGNFADRAIFSGQNKMLDLKSKECILKKIKIVKPNENRQLENIFRACKP